MMFAQDERCGTVPDPNALFVSTQVGGYTLTSFGQVNALMLFIDYCDDNDDPGNGMWPTGGVGPTYMNDVIDVTPTQVSGKKYNITTYFKDMSFGQLIIYGHPVYRQAPKPLWRYQNSTKNDGSPEPVDQSKDVPFYTVQDVLQDLDPTWDFSEFDRWSRVWNTETRRWDHIQAPDGVIDLVIVNFRRWYARYDPRGNYGFIAQGWARPWRWNAISVDNNARRFAFSSTGVINLDMYHYPKSLQIVNHELGHLLLGGNSYHQYSGGMWTLMGEAHGSVSYFMNARERERLGWITFTDITTDNTTGTIPDFGTTGVAYRYKIPGSTDREFIIENHQQLPSTYITSSPDTYTYDLVNRQYGDAPGLYVLKYGTGVPQEELEVVCADGYWNWATDSFVPSPWDSDQLLPVFEKESIDREDGRTDRLNQQFTLNNVPRWQPIFAWIDEQTGDVVNDNWTRQKGDGRDRWIIDEAEMFSPWSNPSSNSFDGDTVNFGMEVTGQSGTNITVKFFTTAASALAEQPSKPQGLSVGPLYSTTKMWPNPKLTWIENIETDVNDLDDPSNAPGSYEIWRKGGANGTWVHAATVSGSVTEYIDYSVTLYQGSGSAYYKLRAKDSQGKVSVYSDEDFVTAQPNALKPVGNNRDVKTESVSIASITPHPAKGEITIRYWLGTSGRLSLDLVNASGQVVDKVIYGEASQGWWRVQYDVSSFPPGVYHIVLQCDDHYEAQKIVIEQ